MIGRCRAKGIDLPGTGTYDRPMSQAESPAWVLAIPVSV